MLNKYKDAIVKLCQLQDEYDKYDIQIATINRNKRRAMKELSRLQSERDDLRDEVRDNLLKRKRSEFDYLQDEIDDAKKAFENLKAEVSSKLENISLDEYDKQTDLDNEILFTLQDTYDYVSKELPDIVGRYEYDYEKCIDTLDKLADKCGRDNLCRPVKSKVLILIDYEEEDDKSVLESILDKIVGVPKDVDFSAKYRVILFSAYLGVIILAFLNFSFLILGGIGLGIKAIYDSKRENDFKEKCIQYLEDFKSMYQILEEHLETGREEFIEKAKLDIASEYTPELEKYQKQIEMLSSDYSLKVKTVTVTEEEINSEVDVVFQSKLDEMKNKIDEFDTQIKRVREEEARCERELDDIQNKITELRDSISNVYWELNSVGTERVLMNEFFLGFKDYDLISVKHDGNAMCIVYDGESCERNSVLISMFIAQLFSNMLPNSLHLTIVDIDFTCRDYSIYNGQYFDLMFNYVTTEDAIKPVIEELHADLIRRQREISPVADDIEIFNRGMIEKNSFTKDYRFLIFQNTKLDYLKNQKLLQLCRTGKTFGIMPIMFISKEIYNEIRNPESKLPECQAILDSTKDYTWRFKHSSLDLEKIGG